MVDRISFVKGKEIHDYYRIPDFIADEMKDIIERYQVYQDIPEVESRLKALKERINRHSVKQTDTLA